MYISAFAGFAAMRAEVSAVDESPRGMTRYAMSVAAVEALGAGLAALLPIDRERFMIPMIIIVYCASLLPTVFSARRARVPGGRPASRLPRASRVPVGVSLRLPVRLPLGLLAGGAAVALFASGPTLLSVALATELHGRSWVAGAAVAFGIGCLLSSVAVDLVGRLHLPATLTWPLWGVGMLIGWVAAPGNVAGLLAAQFLAGLSLTAFEGGMDARLAREAGPGTVTTVLAWGAATRAMGSAVAVRLLPLLTAAPAIGLVSGASATVLATGALLLTGLTATLRRRTPPRPTHPAVHTRTAHIRGAARHKSGKASGHTAQHQRRQ
jgi:hypothetical protein